MPRHLWYSERQKFLTDAAYAIRSTYLAAQEAAPAQLALGRGMALPAGYEADWDEITKRKQKRINDNNVRENKKRIEHEHKRGDMILLTKPGMKLRKASRPRDGPCRVAKASASGALKAQLRPRAAGAASLRRVYPFSEKEEA